MFDDLVIAEKLLHSKHRVTKEAKLSELNKKWKALDDQSEVDQKEMESQIANCTQPNSLWVLRKTPPITRYYRIKGVLGHPGQYGVVRTAVRFSDNKEFAVKVLQKKRFQDKQFKKSFFEDIRVEVYLLSATGDHPNVVECYSVYEDIKSVYLVMCCCNGGELFDRIQSDELFNEQEASKLFRQMVSATYYVHQRGVAHCDLKPENFLFRNKSKDSPLCLIDFGSFVFCLYHACIS